MGRRTLAWLMAVPLAAAGTYVTRCYILAPSESARALHEHGEQAAAAGARVTGVGFFGTVPFLLASLALISFVLVLRILQARNERFDASLSAWPFGVVAPLGFLFHHHFEHLVGSPTELGWLVDSKLLLGLLFQICVGLLAFLLATALLRVADRLGEALRTRRPRRVCPQSGTPSPALLHGLRIALLATAAAPRAPPRALLAPS